MESFAEYILNEKDLISKMEITYELQKKKGLVKESEYMEVVNFMVRNNSENDIKNNKTYWKYFYNIGITRLWEQDYFYFLYNMKPCYYDFVQQRIKIVLSEDLRLEINLKFEDLIQFLKDNAPLFEFEQYKGQYYTEDKIMFNSILNIKH